MSISKSPFSRCMRPKPIAVEDHEGVVIDPVLRSDEAGCLCGKDCTRAPGDGCPIAAMPVWEMTLRGWRGDTDEYDHLVKWVKARSPVEIAEFMARNHPEKVAGTRVWPDPLPAAICLGNGVDFVLSDGRIWAGSMGRTDTGSIGKLFDEYRLREARHYSVDAMVRYLDPRPITVEEMRELRGNSWERELLMERYDDRALVESAEGCLRNCAPKQDVGPSVTYDRAAIELYLPMLIDRLKARL